MKKFLSLMLVAFTLIGLMAAFVSCDNATADIDKEYLEVGDYEFDNAGSAMFFKAKDNEKFEIVVSVLGTESTVISGKYALVGTNLVLTDDDGETLNATYKNNSITIDLEGYGNIVFTKDGVSVVTTAAQTNDITISPSGTASVVTTEPATDPAITTKPPKVKPKEPEGYSVGRKKCPDFVVYTMDGMDVWLSDFYGKMPVLVNFWATWCPPCKSEMPGFNNVYKQMSDKFELLAISDEALTTIQNGKNDADGNKKFTDYTFPIMHDRQVNGGKKLFNNTNFYTGGIPSNFIIDKWGYFYHHSKKLTPTSTAADCNVGGMSESELKARILACIDMEEKYMPPA